LRVCLVVEKTDDNIAGLIFDGGDAGRIHFIISGAIQITAAVCHIVITGCRVTNSEARGVFNDDPGKHQARKLDHAQYEYQQKRQDQGEFNHALRFLTGGRFLNFFNETIVHGCTLANKKWKNTNDLLGNSGE